MDMEPAKTIIDYLGGAKAVAAIVGKHPSRIYRWAYPSSKREGCDGIIPLRDQQKLLEYCRATGVDLVREDFFCADRISGIASKCPETNSPVGSSAGDAGASLPPSDAPASLSQDRAAVAQLVHTQQVAGSNPAPATSFQSPDILPSGVKAGARRKDDAGRAPAPVSEVRHV